MWTMVEVQWDMFVKCIRHICSGIYASNVKCMDAGGSGHIIDCIEFFFFFLSFFLYICFGNVTPLW